jgi:hypothetical protein
MLQIALYCMLLLISLSALLIDLNFAIVAHFLIFVRAR